MSFESGTITLQGQSFKPLASGYMKTSKKDLTAVLLKGDYQHVNNQLNSHKKLQRIQNVGF